MTLPRTGGLPAEIEGPRTIASGVVQKLDPDHSYEMPMKIQRGSIGSA
jgi:hypothetical protein